MVKKNIVFAIVSKEKGLVGRLYLFKSRHITNGFLGGITMNFLILRQCEPKYCETINNINLTELICILLT